jgi:hypothetical protein
MGDNKATSVGVGPRNPSAPANLTLAVRVWSNTQLKGSSATILQAASQQIIDLGIFEKVTSSVETFWK